MFTKITSILIVAISIFSSDALLAQHTKTSNQVNTMTLSRDHDDDEDENEHGNGNGNGNNLVAICHQLGNGGSNTIWVAQAAVQAHLNHGDYLGTCQDDDSEDDDHNDDGDDHNDDGDDHNDDGDDHNDDGDDHNDDGDDHNDDGDDHNDDGDDHNEDGDDHNDDGDDNNDDGDDNDDTTDNGDDSEPVTPSCSPIEVVSFFPGTKNDLLSPVDANRLDATKALGSPEDSDVASTEYNFVSLGFGGEITLKFAYPIHNGEGDDLYVVETTFGNNAQNCSRYPEKIRAFGSQDGCNWVYMGEGCQNSYFDFQSLGWIQYVKLIDISPLSHSFGGGLADGYDLDGVLCLHGEELNPIPAALSNAFAGGVESFTQGLTKGGNAVPAARSNPNNALGAPQGTDAVNFVALGFGGSITLSFDYVVFEKPGDDIQLIETSYGNPSCSNYPETARIEVSLDNETYYMVEGEFCQDQSIDVASAGLAQFRYIRITDASPMSSTRFNSSADAYDVDGVLVLQPGCNDMPARMAAPSETASEMFSESTVYPNPFAGVFNVKFSTGEETENVNIRIVNGLGQAVATENFTSAKNTEITKTLNLEHVNAGIYFVSIERNDIRETFRVIKN